jgi:hypothetical protein
MNERRKDPAFRAAQAAYMKAWRVTHLDTKRAADRAWGKANRLRQRITRKQWKSKQYAARVAALVAQHSGRCDLCDQPPDGRWRRLNIDHCHATNVFRGLLCSRCNRALGFFKDNPALMRRAADYIEQHRKQLEGEAVFRG